MKYLFFAIFSVSFLLGPQLVAAQVTDEVPYDQQLEELQELQQQFEDLSAQLDNLETPDLPEDVQNPGDLPSVSSAEKKGVVVSIEHDETIEDTRQMIFTVEVDGEEYTIDTRESLLDGLRYNIKEGSRVYVQFIYLGDEVTQVYFVDIVRTKALLLITLLFAAVIVAIGRWRGVSALAGLVITFIILFGWVIPVILRGGSPVFTTIIASMVILGVNMHLSHGLNKHTMHAFFSTAIGVFLAWGFGAWFIRLANLSGMANEEAILLQYHSETIPLPAGILLAGIILGAVGVLDDIAITQSETVEELEKANPEMSRTELFTAAMRIGRHHIASTVNTLVLAYAGVALPLLLLFIMTQGVEVGRFINEEPVAEEIIRTLAGTLALILTVPISTWLATYNKSK